MIVADTSAMIAIIQGEPEARAFLARMLESARVFLSAVGFQEAAMVLAGRTRDADIWGELDDLIATAKVEIVSPRP